MSILKEFINVSGNETFGYRSDKDILSTLVHEMCHCFQQHFGTPPRRGYHSREWAAQMISIGLMPSDTGEPGGKQTGQGMSHYIIEGGPFDRAAEALLASGFCLNWQSAAAVAQAGKGAKERSKTKYSCPSCGQNTWGQARLRLSLWPVYGIHGGPRVKSTLQP
jgi:hypothetical protein